MMAGLTKYAVMRFVNERSQPVYIAHVNDVQDFYPKHAKDFESAKKDYMVKWERSFHGDDAYHTGRYPAEILLLGVSEEEVRLKFKANYPKLSIRGSIPHFKNRSSEHLPGKRIRGNQHKDQSLSSTNEVNQVPMNKTSRVKNNNPKNSTSTPAHRSNGTQNVSTLSSEDVTKSTEYLMLEREAALMQLKMERLRKGSQKSNQADSASSVQLDSIMDLNKAGEMEHGTVLNRNLNDSVLNEKSDQIDDQFNKSPDTNENCIFDISESDDDNTIQRVKGDLKGEKPLSAENGKVYIGKNCTIKEKLWRLKVRTAKNNSMFMRMMAQGLWGSKKLKNRTLSGKVRGNISKKLASPHKVHCAMAAFKGYLESKNVSVDAHDVLLKQAKKDLSSKFGDAGRDHDPEYRTKVKKWNEQRKQRKKKGLMQNTDEQDESSSEDEVN